MERTLIKDAKDKIGREITILGRVLNIRELSNVKFLIIQDYSSVIQAVFENEVKAKAGDAVEISGEAREDKRAKGGVEIAGRELRVISACVEDLPFDLSKPNLNLQLATLLDQRPLSLRHPKVQAIFRLYDLLLESYERVMREESFVEIKTPKILEAASEGGANFFKLQYFEKSAYLAQSPQFYKQIMVGVFERVFEIGSVFRAEPHFTTRHVNEFVGLDAEMGFINSFQDVAKMLNKILVRIFEEINERGEEYLKMYEVEPLQVPKEIPQVKLAEIKKIIKEKYHYEIPEGTDIDPEGERMAGRWAREEHHSDFLFITHYPWAERPFYTLPCRDNPEETCGFDLIYKGLELGTGGQRIHLYGELLENMKKKKVGPAGMEYYLDIFKFGMPPHGGWGLGSERMIQQMLGLKSVKEAVLFTRDIKRLSP